MIARTRISTSGVRPGAGGLIGGGFGSDPFLSLHRDMNRLFDDVFWGERIDHVVLIIGPATGQSEGAA